MLQAALLLWAEQKTKERKSWCIGFFFLPRIGDFFPPLNGVFYLALTALVLLYAFVFFRKWKLKGKDALLVNTLMYVYLSFLLYFTLMPVIAKLPYILNHPYKPINMTPFVDVLAGRGDFIRQILLNVIMMVPFGFLFPMTQNPPVGFRRTVFFCFLISLGIELLQPFFTRSADVTDLITNLIGGMVGYVLYIVFRPITSWVLDRLRK